MGRDTFSEGCIKGIRETSKYLLSHHLPKDYYKCYRIKLGSRQIHLCSRCIGIYPGIIIGILFYHFNILRHDLLYYLVIALFPMFALVDWYLSAFNMIKSNNLFRTTSGVLLGIAYSVGVILFFHNFPDYFIIMIGIIYILLAFLFIAKKHRFF